jgi:hypothetical protein
LGGGGSLTLVRGPRLERREFAQRRQFIFQLFELDSQCAELGDAKACETAEQDAKQLVRATGQAESEDRADDCEDDPHCWRVATARDYPDLG